MAPMLKICDKDGFLKGVIEARVGLSTHCGKITRVSEKSVWIATRSGEILFRGTYGIPSVPLYLCPKADRAKAGC